jgi:hypothetical protein
MSTEPSHSYAKQRGAWGISPLSTQQSQNWNAPQQANAVLSTLARGTIIPLTFSTILAGQEVHR